MRDVTRIDFISTLPPAAGVVEAHVDVRLRSHGDSAWQQDHIECTVWSAELPGFAGTIDSTVQKALTLARL